MRSLSEIKEGEVVTMVRIQGGLGVNRRLSGMGLVPGVKIKVLQNSLYGPILIEVKGYSLALGRGESLKVIVKQNERRI